MITNEELWAAIEPRLEGLRGQGPNREARCPLHEHKDGKPFSVNPGKGVWRCHGKGEGGNLYQLAKALGCLPGSPRNSTRVSNLLKVDWGLDAAMRRYNVRVHQRGSIFPIFDHEGNRCRDHVRLHEPQDGRRFEYWGKGRTYHAWVTWGPVREWGKGCGIACITEGNRDALTFAAHGYPAIGVLGVEHFAKVREEAIPHVKAAGIGCLVLNPDNDDPGQQAAYEWAQALASDGFLVGIRALPREVDGQPVKDVFDLYRATGVDFESALLDLPIAWREPS